MCVKESVLCGSACLCVSEIECILDGGMHTCTLMYFVCEVLVCLLSVYLILCFCALVYSELKCLCVCVCLLYMFVLVSVCAHVNFLS